MRLLHKQQESYVVAKGSFAGMFANLDEIRRIHEMHPDFRISIAQKSSDRNIVTESVKSSSRQTSGRSGRICSPAQNLSGQGELIQVEADVTGKEMSFERSQLIEQQKLSTSSLSLMSDMGSGIQGLGDREDVLRNGLDFYKDPDCIGVVDEDGKILYIIIIISFFFNYCLHGLYPLQYISRGESAVEVLRSPHKLLLTLFGRLKN